MLKQSLKVTTPEEAEIFVQQNIKDGAGYIKILHECGAAMGKSFPSFPKPIQAAIVDASHRHGLLCVAHATCLSDTLELLRAGVDGLMHTFCDQMPTSELIEAYKSKHAFCCPTLGIIGSVTTEGKEIAEMFGRDSRVAGIIDEEEQAKMSKCIGMGGEGSKAQYAYESVRQLKAPASTSYGIFMGTR